MAFTYLDLQNEVKRRAVRNQAGTQFDTAAQNIVNTSLFRVSREAKWRGLRREKTFATTAENTTGTLAATNNSATFTGTSTTLITSGIYIGQRIDIQGSSLSYAIETIVSNTSFTTDKVYDGTTASGLTFTIHGREEYNLPLQCGRTGLLWHEEFGYPFVLGYVPTRTFFEAGVPLNTGDIPTAYRMWGEDDVIQQPLEASVMSVVSSSASDVTPSTVTIYGTVSGYPDFQSVTLTGTTPALSTKSFTSVERVVKDTTTVGRITVTANSGNATVAVLPVGDATGHVQYKKVQLYPLPTTAFDMHVLFYKDPWRLVNSTDMHELGGDFDEAIILLSVAKIKAENSQKEAEGWFGMYQDEIRTLKRTNADKLDYFPTLQRPRRRGDGMLHSQLAYSQIGGLYGPSYWF